jgi:hypothetical protein
VCVDYLVHCAEAALFTPVPCDLYAAGVLEPGESRVCQVSFQSGLAPQFFSGEVFCYARYCEEPEGELQAGLPPPAWGQSGAEGQLHQQLQQGVGEGYQAGLLPQQQQDGEEVVEEVIAQHPER